MVANYHFKAIKYFFRTLRNKEKYIAKKGCIPSNQWIQPLKVKCFQLRTHSLYNLSRKSVVNKVAHFGADPHEPQQGKGELHSLEWWGTIRYLWDFWSVLPTVITLASGFLASVFNPIFVYYTMTIDETWTTIYYIFCLFL